MPSTNGITHGSVDDDIDYSDIEAKCVIHIKFDPDLMGGLRYKVQFDDGFDNTLVVDGAPIIDKSKLDKLLAKITKEFSRKGALIKVDDIFVPWDDSKDKSKGYV
jgi:translation initiation factor 3 subunit B